MNRKKKLLFSILPLFLFVSFGEVCVRIIGTQECKPIEPQAGSWETMIGDRDLLWKLEPNRKISIGEEFTVINEIGLRESLLPTSTKKNGEKRIVVTGDSSIYGWGVKDNETYAFLLEKELRNIVPNSVFFDASLGCLTYYPIVMSGTYTADPFDDELHSVVFKMKAPASGDKLVIYPTSPQLARQGSADVRSKASHARALRGEEI